MKKQQITAKQKARLFFKKTKEITSPAFSGEKITFNSKGLSHLFYKGSQKVSSRPDKEAEIRGQRVNSRTDLRKG